MNGLAIDTVGASPFASATLALASCMMAAYSLSSKKDVVMFAWIVTQFLASGGWLIGCRVIHDRFPKHRWGACFAILSVASRSGSMLSKLGLGALLVRLNWHEIGLVAAGVGAVGWAVVAQLLLTTPFRSSEAHASGEDSDYQNLGAKSVSDSLSRTWSRLSHFARDRGLVLYCGVCAGATCVAGFENLAPLILDDLTKFSAAQVSMAATVYPAALLIGVATVPPLVARLDRGRRPSRRQSAINRLFAELVLLAISSTSALGLAVVSSRKRHVPAFQVILLLFGLAFGVSITFYITPNVYALDFGGRDCATASSILDTVGLVVSSLWALCVSAIQARAKAMYATETYVYAAWARIMTLLALIIVATAFLSVAGFFSAMRLQDSADVAQPAADSSSPSADQSSGAYMDDDVANQNAPLIDDYNNSPQQEVEWDEGTLMTGSVARRDCKADGDSGDSPPAASAAQYAGGWTSV